jgi:hypothetical protein
MNENQENSLLDKANAQEIVGPIFIIVLAVTLLLLGFKILYLTKKVGGGVLATSIINGSIQFDDLEKANNIMKQNILIDGNNQVFIAFKKL